MNLRSLLSLSEDVKRIGLYGIGRSSLALLDVLPRDAEITLRSDSIINRKGIPNDRRITKIYDGECACDGIREQILFFSPSVRRDKPALIKARERGVLFCSDAELFFKSNTAPVYAVTGSDGKSTTATLISLLLSEKHGKPSLCGNIGVPFLSTEPSDVYVAELSSFQLTYLSTFTERAVITNIVPNHLNWHASFEEYKSAKLSLLSHTRGEVLSVDDAILSEAARRRSAFALISTEEGYEKIKKNYIFSVAYTLEGGNICRNGVPYMPVEALFCREKYNVKNFMSALGACDGEVSRVHAIRVAGEFHGLEHRCERFQAFRGVDYFNSSIDTSPDRTAATLSSLGRRCIVILGGRSKGLSFGKLVPILQIYAKEAVLQGECADEIEEALHGKVPTRRFDTLTDAAGYCMSAASFGEAVILSPAATSYDAFSSFEERGEYFKKIINEYIKQEKCK